MTAKIGGMRRRRRLPLRIVAASILTTVALATLSATAAGAAPWGAASGNLSADRDYVAAVERLRAEDYPAAVALLENLAERLPGSAEVFNHLGYTYRKVGRDAAALAAYQRALFLAPGNRRVRAELGALYLKRGFFPPRSGEVATARGRAALTAVVTSRLPRPDWPRTGRVSLYPTAVDDIALIGAGAGIV